jgi:hypothetical protein
MKGNNYIDEVKIRSEDHRKEALSHTLDDIRFMKECKWIMPSFIMAFCAFCMTLQIEEESKIPSVYLYVAFFLCLVATATFSTYDSKAFWRNLGIARKMKESYNSRPHRHYSGEGYLNWGFTLHRGCR